MADCIAECSNAGSNCGLATYTYAESTEVVDGSTTPGGTCYLKQPGSQANPASVVSGVYTLAALVKTVYTGISIGERA